MPTRIVVNGREYSDVESMPPDVRRVYEQMLARLADSDGDGVPDIVQRAREGGSGVDVTEIHHSSFTINGRSFDNVDDLPPEVRRLYEASTDRRDVNRNGIPDALEAQFPRFSGGFSPAGERGVFTFRLTLGSAVLLLAILAAVVALVWIVASRR